MTDKNNATVNQSLTVQSGDALPSLGAATGSVIRRPRNGDEVVKAIANGATVEVPSGYGTKTLGYLQARLSGSWGADCQLGKFNKGWFAIEPDKFCVRLCAKLLSQNIG